MTELPTSFSSPNFQHRHAAHCESGVTASLATHQGRTLSEPMAFGIGSGIFFGHLPFVKVMDLPLTTFRSFPGTILAKTFKRTGVRYEKYHFRKESTALSKLDSLLAQGLPVGVQLSVFWLPYLPPQFRFQFNAHHAIVCGRGSDHYVISDPVGETMVTCPIDDFRRAWFAKGPLAPKGALYVAEPNRLETLDLTKAVRSGLGESCNRMLRIPFPYLGISGIRKLSGIIAKWSETLREDRRIKLNLGQVVRMQEEIGTGGAGFRFLYAAFLQEAAQLTSYEFLHSASDLITESGDQWRKFAIASAKLCKQGSFNKQNCGEIAAILMECAESEEKAFRLIDKNLRMGKKAWA